MLYLNSLFLHITLLNVNLSEGNKDNIKNIIKMLI